MNTDRDLLLAQLWEEHVRHEFATRDTDAKVPVFAMAAVFVAIGLQLVPLPSGVIEALSPNALGVMSKLELLYAIQGGPHPLSITPPATWHALALFVALGTLIAGLTKFLSATGTRWLIGSLTVMGAVLAFVDRAVAA